MLSDVSGCPSAMNVLCGKYVLHPSSAPAEPTIKSSHFFRQAFTIRFCPLRFGVSKAIPLSHWTSRESGSVVLPSHQNLFGFWSPLP